MKPKTYHYCAGFGGLLLFTVVNSASGVVIVEDVASNVITTNLNDNIFTTELGVFPTFISSDGGGRRLFGAVDLGDRSLLAFSEGGTLAVSFGSSHIFPEFSGGVSGVNFLRFDSDFDSIFETVIEVNLDDDLVIVDVPRFAFDSTGNDFDVPAAVIAFNAVPEPSVGFLAGLGCLIALKRRR